VCVYVRVRVCVFFVCMFILFVQHLRNKCTLEKMQKDANYIGIKMLEKKSDSLELESARAN